MRRLVVAIAAVLVAGAAWAQGGTYPERPIRFVIPYPPGGTSDNLGRLIAEKLRGALGQPLVAENKPGGTSMPGAEAVAWRKPRSAAAAARSELPRSRSPAPPESPHDPVAKLRAGRDGRDLPRGDHRAQRPSGEELRRARRARQEGAGQAHLRLGRDRIVRQHGGRDDQAQAGHRHRARAVQGLRRPRRRPPRRADRRHHRRRRPAAREERQGARTCHVRRNPPSGPAGDSVARRGGAQDRFAAHLVGDLRPGRARPSRS